MATRPLFTTGSGNRKFFYTCDGNKNVSELVHFETRNGIAAHYDYAPFGAVTRAISASTITDNTFTTDNPFRFSSEYHDDTLGLVYYNYRHYNPTDGRWCGRDLIREMGGINIYLFVQNRLLDVNDSKGLRVSVLEYGLESQIVLSVFKTNENSVEKHVDQIKKISEERFREIVDSGRVTIDGEVFRGDIHAYIQAVEKEKHSSHKLNPVPTYEQFKQDVEQQSQKLAGREDLLVIALHGTIRQEYGDKPPVIEFASDNEFMIGADDRLTADVKEFLSKVQTRGRIALISCYQSQPLGNMPMEAYEEGVYFRSARGEIVKGKKGCEIKFTRMQAFRQFRTNGQKKAFPSEPL